LTAGFVAAAAVRQSVFRGVAVAQKIHSASLLASVRAAFMHGMDMALLVSAGIALAGVVLTLLCCLLSRPDSVDSRACLVRGSCGSVGFNTPS
jgi:hypothetical protein